MPISHLIVTPLPNGRNGNIGSLSVHLSPRLRSGGVLGDYPEYRNWGAFLSAAPAMQFTVSINGVPLPAGNVTLVSAVPAAITWQALFGPPASSDLKVDAFTFLDRTQMPPLTSIDTAAMVDLFAELRRKQVLNGSQPLTMTDLEPSLGGLAGLDTSAAAFLGSVGNGQTSDVVEYDFHSILSALNAHPQLLRALGLVFDFQVNLPNVAMNTVQVTTNWAAKAGRRARDEVPCETAVDNTFRPVVGLPAYRTAGWLALSSSHYRVVELDTVNAASQLRHIADVAGSVTDPTAPVGVPAVIESGISVCHLDLATLLVDQWQRSKQIDDAIDLYVTTNNAPPPVLIAEDITTGYRIDAEDVASPGFRSLHLRHAAGGYQFARNAAANFTPADDEGWVSVGMVTDGTPQRPAQTSAVAYKEVEGPITVAKSVARDETRWRVGDAVATWDGWSLAALRPSSVATPDGTPKPAAVSAPGPTDEAKVQINYSVVPDTLPRLRYGHTYAMRARTVDLAGNGPGLADTPDVGIPQVVFGRTLPVPPPTVLYRGSRPDPGVGVSSQTLVIRSELGQADVTVPTTDRLCFPPRISQARLERHDLPNGGVDPASYSAIVARDAASLEAQCLVDPETGDLVAGAAIVDGAVTLGALNQPASYLLDPMTRGVAFHNLPGSAGSIVMVNGTWPNQFAVDLRLRAGSGAPTSSNANRQVTVSVPQGRTFHVGVSCAPVLARLDHMADWNLLTPSQQSASLASALAGQLIGITAWGDITLVHAVRIPLTPPSFGAFSVARTTLGQTDMVLDGTLMVHCFTVDRATLTGQWTDTVDITGESGPRDVTTRAVVGDVGVAESDAVSAPVTALSYDLGDPRRRSVELSIEAFCRYSRYFTEQLDATMPAAGTIVLDTDGVAESSVTVTDRTTGQSYVRGVDFTVDRGAGSVSRTSVTAIPDGTELRVLYIPLPISRLSSEAESGQTVVVDVPASSPPSAPALRAVVPAFARTVTETANTITIVHDGRVLRALIERPWFSSGSGETLGVAVDLASVATPVLTRWARDPVFAGSGPRVSPAIADFPRATSSLADADGRFDVAGHPVAYDADRQVWTADILVDADFGYRPWVQLALCRFQPLAVDGAHVSDTVDCEPVRLGALRTVTVSSQSIGTVAVTLAGRDAVSRVRVTTQVADPAIGDPDLRWQNVASTSLLRSGTTSAATFTGNVTLPAGAERRLLIEESEATKIEINGALASSTAVAYRELVTLPAEW